MRWKISVPVHEQRTPPPVTHSPAGSAVSSVIRVGCGSLSRMPDCLWHLVPPHSLPNVFLAASPKAHSCSRWWGRYRGDLTSVPGPEARRHFPVTWSQTLFWWFFISDLTEDDKHIVVEWNCESNWKVYLFKHCTWIHINLTLRYYFFLLYPSTPLHVMVEYCIFYSTTSSG